MTVIKYVIFVVQRVLVFTRFRLKGKLGNTSLLYKEAEVSLN